MIKAKMNVFIKRNEDNRAIVSIFLANYIRRYFIYFCFLLEVLMPRTVSRLQKLVYYFLELTSNLDQ